MRLGRLSTTTVAVLGLREGTRTHVIFVAAGVDPESLDVRLKGR